MAIFVDTSPRELLASLDDPVARDALRLSLEDDGDLDRADPRDRHARRLLPRDAAVPGPRDRDHAGRASARASARGRRHRAAGGGRPAGILGGAVSDAGVELVLETAGVVVALTFVASPFYVRQAQAAFGSVDRTLIDAARTLGASEARTFARVAIPAAMPSLVAGTALALGRALGEFGATLMFAGSFRGITQTVPLAIYDRFATDFPAALALSAVLVALSAAILLSVKLVGGAEVLGGRAARLTRARVSASSSWTWRSRSQPAQCLALAGPSGAGKTSVLRIAAGLAAPGRGRVVVR